MSTIKEIAPKVWKLNVDSNLYFLDLNEKVVIDTGPGEYKAVVRKELGKVISLDRVDRVLFTHLHYDHTGNFDLFPNAKFYASREEIGLLKENRLYAICNPVLAIKFRVKLSPLNYSSSNNSSSNNFLDSGLALRVIKTPGHTKGSVCFYYPKEKILFSGDTLFFNGIGRTDFPFSEPERMEESLKKIGRIKYAVLAPGHDY